MKSCLPLRHVAYPLAAVCVVTACGDWQREPRTRAKVEAPAATANAAPALSVIPTRDECFVSDSLEHTAMRCADGAASRIGDTLVIRLTGVGFRKLVDQPRGGDSSLAFRYAGRIGGSSGTPAFHVIDVHDGRRAASVLLNALTGDSVTVARHPVISADGARFAVAATDFIFCQRSTTLEVWRITGDRPVREYTIVPFTCGATAGWGPSDVEWRARDTLAFTRNALPLPSDSARRASGDWERTPGVLVHQASGWTMDPRRPTMH
jgi:hypothetical protein